MVIHRPMNEPPAMFTDCATSNPLRVVVVDRRPVEVTGLTSGCSLPADESVPTVEGLFDLAATAAAASEHSIVLDDRWGYVNSIDVFEGISAPSAACAGWSLPPRPYPSIRRWSRRSIKHAAPGCDSPIRLLVRPPLTRSSTCWAAHTASPSLDGQPAGIERTDGQPFDESLAAELPGTIEEVSDVITDNLGRDPDLVIAGIHPELGYPTDATFDHKRNAERRRVRVVVTNFETA